MSDQATPAKGADQAHEQLWEQGLSIRREVVGSQHVDRSLQNATSFSRPMQEYATEVGWVRIPLPFSLVVLFYICPEQIFNKVLHTFWMLLDLGMHDCMLTIIGLDLVSTWVGKKAA